MYSVSYFLCLDNFTRKRLITFVLCTYCVCALFVKMSRHTLYEHKRKCAKCNITAAEDINLSFHRFPLPGRHTMLKARVWAEYCYPTGEWSTEKSLRDLHSQHKMLCSKHFDDSSFTSSARIRLNNYAIPIGTQDLMVKFRQEHCTTSGSEQDTNISVEKPQKSRLQRYKNEDVDSVSQRNDSINIENNIEPPMIPVGSTLPDGQSIYIELSDVTEVIQPIMANHLPLPEKLDLEGDSISVGLKWEKWKRSVLLYLEAADIVTPAKKRATLLVLGGMPLQEIYYNLPGASVEPEENMDVFEIAINKLNEYFLPKQSKIYERYIFRLIKQEAGENFEKFLIKLRNQAAKCKFDKPDEHIIDQIIEKCRSSDLRKKILTMGDEITLDEVITVANTQEFVDYQLESREHKDWTKTNEVNAIKCTNKEGSRSETQGKQDNEDNRPSKFTRCGTTTYHSQRFSCLAKDKKWTKSNQLKRKFKGKTSGDKNYIKRRIKEERSSNEFS